MSQHFINRKEELNYLTNRLNSKNSEFLVFYGRRRIGKSELITHFIKKNQGIYYLSSKEGDKENLKNFSLEISKFLGDDNFSNVVYENWQTLFNALKNHTYFKERSKKDKIIITIDEFPYLIHSNNAISSIFQKIWDEILKFENVLFIVLGSSISIMESEVLAYKSPLYGRRSGQWEVTPLNIGHFKHFYPNLTFKEYLQIWFCLGGVPEYLKKFKDNLNIYDNIEKNILEKGNYLGVDAELILNEEFKETKNYKLILKSMSFGNTTMGDIINDTGLDKSMVSKYLDVLENIKLVKGELPIISKVNAKGNKYYIDDSYFNFWFKYYYRNRINLETLGANGVIKLIKKDFQKYSGIMFERFILKHLPFFIKNFNYEKIGKQWGKFHKRLESGDKRIETKTYEIDICAINNDNKEILFGECKWQDNVDGNKILKELKEKSKLVNWNNENRKEKYVIFAKSFKDKNIKNCTCYDLSDLEKIFK